MEVHRPSLFSQTLPQSPNCFGETQVSRTGQTFALQQDDNYRPGPDKRMCMSINWIDVSIQESLASELVLNEPYYAWSGGIQGRRPVSGDGLGNLLPCKDGYVVIQLAGAKTWEDIVDFLDEPALGAPEFMTAAGRNLNANKLDAILGRRLLELGMHELFDEGTRRRLLVGMAQEPKDLLACPQLAARGYFVEVDHPVTGRLPYPGEPVKMSATPWSLRRRPPLLGEHNEEVFSQKWAGTEELVEAVLK